MPIHNILPAIFMYMEGQKYQKIGNILCILFYYILSIPIYALKSSFSSFLLACQLKWLEKLCRKIEKKN
jgi:hypothetical protein